MHFDAQRERREKARGKERNGRETKAIGENERQGTAANKDGARRCSHTAAGGVNRGGKTGARESFSTRKKSESRPALVSIAGCAVSLTFPLFVKRSAGRVLFAFK